METTVKTDIDSYGFTCYWRIENFHFKSNNNFSIKSPLFEIKALKSKWYIEITEEEGFFGVFIFKATDPKYCLTKFCISLLTSTDWVPVKENPNYRYRDGGCGYGMFKILSLEELKEKPWVHLPNGSLTISFLVRNNKLESESSQCLIISRMVNENESLHRPIEFFSSLKPFDLLSFPPTYNFHPKEMSVIASDQKSKEVKTLHTQTEASVDYQDGGELLKLFKKKEFSFVTLRTPNKEFVVHKAVLCGMSPVFNALFESQVKENNCNLIDIDDIDSQTMTLLVQFLHFQLLDDLNWDTAITLYNAAHKYQIDSLKRECVMHLKKGLSVENLCDVFLLANLHEDNDLMSCAQEYFGKNLKLVFTSKQWKDLLCHTELVSKILHELGEKM